MWQQTIFFKKQNVCLQNNSTFPIRVTNLNFFQVCFSSAKPEYFPTTQGHINSSSYNERKERENVSARNGTQKINFRISTPTIRVLDQHHGKNFYKINLEFCLHFSKQK